MAETHYQQLIQMEPDNPDGYGELGNMYFAQGQWEQAAAAYYEAGVRLLETGMVAEARQMVDVIRGLNGAQADDLQERINAAS
jgi:tetratricopeptide (TPR) repeat protein